MFPVHDISATGFPTILILNKFKWVKVPLYLPQNFTVVTIFKDPTSIKKGINTGCGGLYSSQLGFQSCIRLWFHFPSDPGSAENSGWRRSMLGLGAQGPKQRIFPLSFENFKQSHPRGHMTCMLHLRKAVSTSTHHVWDHIYRARSDHKISHHQRKGHPVPREYPPILIDQ